MNQPSFTSSPSILQQFRLRRGLLLGVLILAALLAFEMFNYSTTEYSLRDLLGELTFLSVKWSTILSIAFCGIDFAGLARMFTPEQGADEPAEVWYLFGAWLLAATMNAMLTWWGVSVAILNHPPSMNALVDRSQIIKIVPVFVAVMVWLIRVLIIGAFSVAGDKIFAQPSNRNRSNTNHYQSSRKQALPGMSAPPVKSSYQTGGRPVVQQAFRPVPKPAPAFNNQRPEPTYHPISMSATGREREDF